MKGVTWRMYDITDYVLRVSSCVCVGNWIHIKNKLKRGGNKTNKKVLYENNKFTVITIFKLWCAYGGYELNHQP